MNLTSAGKPYGTLRIHVESSCLSTMKENTIAFEYEGRYVHIASVDQLSRLCCPAYTYSVTRIIRTSSLSPFPLLYNCAGFPTMDIFALFKKCGILADLNNAGPVNSTKLTLWGQFFQLCAMKANQFLSWRAQETHQNVHGFLFEFCDVLKYPCSNYVGKTAFL